MEPIVIASPRRLNINYNGHGVLIDVAQIEEYSHGIHGEVTIHFNEHKLLQYETINFSSRGNLDKTESRCVKIISSYGMATPDNAPPWDQIFEDCRIRVIEHHRRGEPVISGGTSDTVKRPEYYVYPFIPRNEVTIFFAEVESCKSLLASLFAGLIGSNWWDYPGGLGFKINWGPEPGNALILDNETNYDTYLYNLSRLAKGFGGQHFFLNYRRLRRALADDVEQVKRYVTENGVNFLVIDSLMRAAGGDVLKTETVNRLFDAIDYIGVTTLIPAHQPKSYDAIKSVYGNAFFQYLPRSVWRIEKSKETDSDTLDLALFHVKGNLSKRFKPVGYRFTFDDAQESISLAKIDVEKTELSQYMDCRHKILAYLKEMNGTPADPKVIAEAISEKPKTVTIKLSEMKKRGETVNLGNGGWVLAAKGFF